MLNAEGTQILRAVTKCPFNPASCCLVHCLFRSSFFRGWATTSFWFLKGSCLFSLTASSMCPNLSMLAFEPAIHRKCSPRYQQHRCTRVHAHTPRCAGVVSSVAHHWPLSALGMSHVPGLFSTFLGASFSSVTCGYFSCLVSLKYWCTLTGLFHT